MVDRGYREGGTNWQGMKTECKKSKMVKEGKGRKRRKSGR